MICCDFTNKKATADMPPNTTIALVQECFFKVLSQILKAWRKKHNQYMELVTSSLKLTHTIFHQSLQCAVSCSMRSITTTGLFCLPPLGANPLVPSGPLGCLVTTTLAAPRAFSSMFIVFSLEMSLSGRWALLRKQKDMT